MGREHRGDRQLLMPDPRHGHARHPFMKMGDHRRRCAKLLHQRRKKFGGREPEGDHLIHFPIIRHGRNAVILPQEVFVPIEIWIPAAIIQQNDPRPAGGKPAAEVTPNPLPAKAIQRLADKPVGSLFLKFRRRGLRVVWTDQKISLAPAVQHGWNLGSQDRVNSAQLPTDLPADLKQQRLLIRIRLGGWSWRGSGRLWEGGRTRRAPGRFTASHTSCWPRHGGALCLNRLQRGNFGPVTVGQEFEFVRVRWPPRLFRIRGQIGPR